MTAKAKITLDQIMNAVAADENLGFCLTCGCETENVEPDARKYQCRSCGAFRVYGAEKILFMVS